MAFYNNDIISYNNVFGISSIILHSINAPTNSITETKPISTNKYNIDFFDTLFFKTSYKKMPPREIAKPYDTNSKIPKGVRKTIKGLAKLESDKFTIELKINPVENAEKLPTTIPKIGINITRAILKLFKKMPTSSMPCSWFLKFFDNSSEKDLSNFIENPS
jgi:hypothetical protein